MKAYTFILALFISVLSYSQNDIKIIKQGDLFKVTYFHSNGNISQTGFIDADKRMQGTWISYTPTGNKNSTGEYNNGKKIGTWYFGEHKELVTQVNFGDDHRVATVIQLSSDKSQLADSDLED
ncbi:MAG: toxin-antitoxin system YwqK family antitoxin [Wenyingzhuangia sp.]